MTSEANGLVLRCFSSRCAWGVHAPSAEEAKSALAEHRKMCPGPALALSIGALQIIKGCTCDISRIEFSNGMAIEAKKGRT